MVPDLRAGVARAASALDAGAARALLARLVAFTTRAGGWRMILDDILAHKRDEVAARSRDAAAPALRERPL